jgi:hypothetical protein
MFRIPTRPTIPSLGGKSPHEDVGDLVHDFLGDIKSVGEQISSSLDEPVRQTVGIKGPHRIASNVLDFGVEIMQDTINKVLRR